jgi:hypothetical protein
MNELINYSTDMLWNGQGTTLQIVLEMKYRIINKFKT